MGARTTKAAARPKPPTLREQLGHLALEFGRTKTELHTGLNRSTEKAHAATSEARSAKQDVKVLSERLHELAGHWSLVNSTQADIELLVQRITDRLDELEERAKWDRALLYVVTAAVALDGMVSLAGRFI